MQTLPGLRMIGIATFVHSAIRECRRVTTVLVRGRGCHCPRPSEAVIVEYNDWMSTD